MYNNTKPRAIVFDALKKAFPYFMPEGDDSTGVFYSAQVGTSDEFNVLIRINVGHRDTNEVTFGVVDDEREQFLYNDMDKKKQIWCYSENRKQDAEQIEKMLDEVGVQFEKASGQKYIKPSLVFGYDELFKLI